jgi:hypothetical protein
VYQISGKDLLSRKISVVLRSIDPVEIQTGLHGIWSGLLAVIATLKMRFAQGMTLGVSIGDVACASIGPHLARALARAAPSQEKWAPVVAKWVLRTMAVSMALFFFRVVTSFHAAVRGAQLFTRGLVVYLEKRKIIPDVDETGPIFVAISFVLAMTGFWWQVSSLFTVPFPFNLLLLPLSIAESLLVMAMGNVNAN